MSNTSQRTQIILSKKLREDIEKVRSKTGESLAEYLRKAAEQRLNREQVQTISLKKLAEEVIGSEKNSSWKNVDVVEWQREIRRDRS